MPNILFLLDLPFAKDDLVPVFSIITSQRLDEENQVTMFINDKNLLVFTDEYLSKKL